MISDNRAAYLTRDNILRLLSDAEVARVSMAETALRVADDEEYVDLTHLERGVQRGKGTSMQVGNVLPRAAVQERTWKKIVSLIGRPRNGGM